MRPQQACGQKSSGVNDLGFMFLRKQVTASTYFDVQGESKRTGPMEINILKIDVDMIFEKLVSGI